MKKFGVIFLVLALGCLFTACTNSNAGNEGKEMYEDPGSLDNESLFEDKLREEDSIPVDDLEEHDSLNLKN